MEPVALCLLRTQLLLHASSLERRVTVQRNSQRGHMRNDSTGSELSSSRRDRHERVYMYIGRCRLTSRDPETRCICTMAMGAHGLHPVTVSHATQHLYLGLCMVPAHRAGRHMGRLLLSYEVCLSYLSTSGTNRCSSKATFYGRRRPALDLGTVWTVSGD